MTIVPRTYLDHAATTPMVPEAIEAMSRELGRVGNASSLHASGRAARKVVEDAREAIAACVGARPVEVIFTSGGTEADNLAVKGAFWSRPERTSVITSAIEHHAVLETVHWLGAAAGAKTTILPVDRAGVVDPADLSRAVDSSTSVVSVIWGNNEVGTLQPVARLAEIARGVGALAHSDAVQAVGRVPVDFGASGLDLMTFTAHKLGGPIGVGALLARREVLLTPTAHGGGQERDIRSGTLDVAAIASFAAAALLACGRVETEAARLRALRAALIEAVRAADPAAVIRGPESAAATLPHVLNVGFPGCSADALLLLLDAAGIDCATGSACSAGVTQPSHVLAAMGFSDTEAMSSLRFSLGHSSTEADIAALGAALPQAVARARSAGPVGLG